MFRCLIAAAIVGAASTLADWIWARYLRDGAVLPGVVHGVLIFVLLAIALGWAGAGAGAIRRLLATLPITGLLIAAAFYPIAIALGYLEALLITWAAMWLSLSLLQRWARDRFETLASAFVRGTVAALASGLAFWSVSGMWTDPSAYAGHGLRWAYWSFAFLPGFFALLCLPGLGRKRRR